jgi:FAD binding domain
MILEKSDQVGGTTAISAGTLWVPGALAATPEESAREIEAVRLYLRKEVPGSGQDPKTQGFQTTGPKAVEFVQTRTSVRDPKPRHVPQDGLSPRAGAVSLVLAT